jgi:dolichol-phosphate mannosyltransferase
MKISAVVACYRDAQAVPLMYERLVSTITALGADVEIVFVNDASPDNARDVLAGLAAQDRRVVVINHSRPFGSQSAFTSGMRVASGDAVVLLDGDLQDPPEIIPQFVAKWQEGFDVVYGTRVKREAPRLMQIAYKLFYRLFKRLAYVSVPLDAGDFGLMDRRVVDALNSLPESHRFIRGLRAWVGYKQTGVPYERPERMFGVTTNSLLKNIGWARRAIISFSFAPLDLMMWLSLITVALSAIGLVAQLITRLVDPSLAPKGYTTLIVVILFVGGMQLLCTSIVASYLAHMYDETKRRPSAIVESILNAPANGDAAAGVPNSAPAQVSDELA